MGDFCKFIIRFYHRLNQDGLTVLAVASAFMAGWFRSRFVQDDFLIEARGDESYHLRSQKGVIHWVYRVWSINGPRYEEELASLPYWTIILPLTLLAAYLLLKSPTNDKPA